MSAPRPAQSDEPASGHPFAPRHPAMLRSRATDGVGGLAGEA
jgi:hypothetical protein